MGQEIDQRIVQMRFENSQFENGVRNTLATLGRLKDALKFGASVSGLGDLQYAFDAINVNKLNSALDTINYRFSTLGVAGARVIDNLVDRAMNGIDRVAGQLKSGGYNRALNLARAKFQLKGLDIDWDESLKTGIAADIDKAVSGTAYGLDAAAKAASQLSASGIEIGDSMYTALRGIAGVAGMTNSTYEDIAHIFTGIAGNGRVYANDLMMLAGRGLNATAVLGKALGKTEAEIKEMVSDAQIDFKTFSDAMFNAFGEHAEKANETFEGALSNVKAGLSRIGEKFATPYMENAQKVLAALIPVLKAVNVAIKPLVDETTKIMELISGFASEKLTGLVTKLEDGSYQLTNNFITPIAEGLVNIIESVKGMGKAIGEAFGDIFPESDSNILMNIANKFKDVTAVIRYFFTGAIDESSESVKKFIDAFGSNIPMLEDFKSVIRAIAAIVRTLSDILTALWKNVLKPLATTVLPKILDFLGKIGNKITEFLGYLHDINIFSSITSAFAEPILGSTEKAKAAIEEVGEKTAKVSKSAAKSASAAIKTTEKAQTKSTKRLIENNEELLDIAERVIRGEFGNGEKRRQLLEDLGYYYEQIQNKVNEINGDPFRYEIPDELAENADAAADAIDNLDDAIQNAGSGMSGRLIQDAALLDEMANKVIRGDYGNGQERIDRLTEEGFNYEQIQNRVNENLGNDFRYEIPQEVIDEANAALEAQAAANEEAQRKVEETHRALMGGSKPNNPFYQYEDKVKGPIDNLITTAKGLGAGFDIIFQAVKAIYEVIAKPVVLEVVPKVLGMVLERTASLGEKLIKLDEFLKKNNVFENVLKAISAPFKWLYDFIQNFSLTDAFGAIADGAGVAFGAISDLGNSIVGFLKPKLESLKDFKISDLGLPDTKKVAEDFSNFLTSLPGKVSEKFGSIKETVQNSAIGQFFVGLKTDFDNFRKDFPGNLITNLIDLKDKLLAMPFTTVISEWGGAIKDFVLSLPETIGGKFTAIQEKLSGLELGKIFEDAKSAATDFLGDIPGKVSEAFSKVREYLTNIGSISEFFGDAKEAVAGFIGEFPGNVVAAFEKIKSYLPNIDIKSTFENAKAAVEDFFSGLAFDPTKIFSKENFNAVIGQIRTWLQEAYEAVKNFFAERAFNPFEGIFDSIDSFLEKPGQAIHDKINSLTEPIEGFSFVTDWISNIFQGLNDLIPYDKIDTFSEMFRADPYEAILTLLRSIGSEIEGIATAATDVIGGGILGAISEAGSFFTETNLPILSTIGDWIDEIHQKIDGIIESVRDFFEENAIGQMFDSVINKLIGVVNTVSVFFTGKELFKTVEQAKEIVTEDGGIVVPMEIDPKYEKKVSNTFGSAIATLNENGAIEIVDAAQIGIIDRIIARLKTLFSSFTNIADKADEFFSDPVGNIRQSTEALFGYIQERVNDLITSFGEHPVVQSITQGANSVISFVTENVGKLLEFFGPDKIKEWYDQSVVKKLLENPLISLETGITKFVEVAQKIFTAIANSPIKQMAENSVTMFGTFIVDSFTSIKNTFSGDNIKAWYDQSWLKQLVNNPIDTIGDVITSFITKLGNFAEKLENTLIDSWPKVQSVVTFIVNTRMSWQIASLIGSISTAIAPAGGINFAVTRILNSVDDLGTNLLQLGLGMMMLASAFNAFNAMGVSPMTLIHIIGGIYIFEKYGPALLGSFTRFGKGIGTIAKGIKRLTTGKEAKKAAKDAKEAKKAVESAGGSGRRTNFFGLNDISSTILAVGFGVMMITHSIGKLADLNTEKDPNRMLKAIGGFALILTVVAAIPKVISGLSKVIGKKLKLPDGMDKSDPKKGIAGFLDEFSTQVIAIGASLLLLSVALKVVSTMDPDKMWQSGLTLGLTFTAVAVVMGIYNKALAKMKAANPQNSIGTFSSLAGLALDIVAAAAAIWIIGNTISEFKDYDVDQFSNSGIALLGLGSAVGILMFVTSKVVKIAGESQYALGASLGIAADILSAAGAMWLIADVISQFKDYSTDDIDKIKKIFPALAWFVGGIVAVIETGTTLSQIFGKGKNSLGSLSGIAIVITAVTVSFAVIANSIEPLTKLNPKRFESARNMMIAIGAYIAGITTVAAFAANSLASADTVTIGKIGSVVEVLFFITAACAAMSFMIDIITPLLGKDTSNVNDIAEIIAVIGGVITAMAGIFAYIGNKIEEDLGGIDFLKLLGFVVLAAGALSLVLAAITPLANIKDIDGEGLSATILSVGGALAAVFLSIGGMMKLIGSGKDAKGAVDAINDVSDAIDGVSDTLDGSTGKFAKFKEGIGKVKDGIFNIGTAAKDAAAAIVTAGLGGSLSAILLSVGAIAGVSALAVKAIQEVSSSIEEMQGGNGIKSFEGNAIDGFIKALEEVDATALSEEQEDILWKLKETRESYGETEEQVIENFAKDLSKYNISREQYTAALTKMMEGNYATDELIEKLNAQVDKYFKEESEIIESGTRNMVMGFDFSAYKDQKFDFDNDLIDDALKIATAQDQSKYIAITSIMSEYDNKIDTLEGWYNLLSEKAVEIEGINMDDFANAFKNVFPDLKEDGKHAAEGMITGYKEKENDIRNTAKEGAAIFPEETENELSISSPSKRMKVLGIWTAQGFIDGVALMTNEIRSTASSMSDTFLTNFKSVVDKTLSFISLKNVDFEKTGAAYIDGIISGAESKKQDLLNYFADIAKLAKEAYDNEQKISSPSKEMAESGKYTISGLMFGIKKGLKKVYALGKEAGVQFDTGYRDFMGIHSDSDREIDSGHHTIGGIVTGLLDKAGDLKDTAFDIVEDTFGKNGLSGKLSDLTEGLQDQIAGIGDSVISTMMKAAGLDDLQDLFENGVDGDWLKQLEEMSGMDFEEQYKELAKGYDFSELGDSGIDSYISSLQKALEDMPEDSVEDYLKALTEIGDSTEDLTSKTIELSEEGKKAYGAVADQVKSVFSAYGLGAEWKGLYSDINQDYMYDKTYEFAYQNLRINYGLAEEEAAEQAKAIAEKFLAEFNEMGAEAWNEFSHGMWHNSKIEANVYSDVRNLLNDEFGKEKLIDLNPDYIFDTAYDWSFDRLIDRGFTEEQAKAKAYEIASVYAYQLKDAMQTASDNARMTWPIAMPDETDLSSISDQLITMSEAAEGWTDSLARYVYMIDHEGVFANLKPLANDVGKILSDAEHFGNIKISDINPDDAYNSAYDLIHDKLIDEYGYMPGSEELIKDTEALASKFRESIESVKKYNIHKYETLSEAIKELWEVTTTTDTDTWTGLYTIADRLQNSDEQTLQMIDMVNKRLMDENVFGNTKVADMDDDFVYNVVFDWDKYEGLLDQFNIAEEDRETVRVRLAGLMEDYVKDLQSAYGDTEKTFGEVNQLSDMVVDSLMGITNDDSFDGLKTELKAIRDETNQTTKAFEKLNNTGPIILTDGSEGVPENSKSDTSTITPPSIQIDEKEIEDVGKNVDKGLADSMIKHKPLTDKAAKKVGSGVTDTIHTESGCASPSWKTALTGMYVILGFVKGLKAFAPLLEDTASDIGDLAINALGKNKVTKNKLSTFSKNLLNPLANVTEKGLEKIANSIVGGTSPLITETKDDLDSLVAASVETATLFSKAYSGAILAKRDDLYKASTKAKDSTLTGLKSNGEAGKAGQGVVDEFINVVDQNGPELQATGQGAGEQINSGIQDSVDDVNVSATASVSGVSGGNLSVPVNGVVSISDVPTTTVEGKAQEVEVPVDAKPVLQNDEPLEITVDAPTVKAEGEVQSNIPELSKTEILEKARATWEANNEIKLDGAKVTLTGDPESNVEEKVTSTVGADIVAATAEISRSMASRMEPIKQQVHEASNETTTELAQLESDVEEKSGGILDAISNFYWNTIPAIYDSIFGQVSSSVSGPIKEDVVEATDDIVSTISEKAEKGGDVIGKYYEAATYGYIGDSVERLNTVLETTGLKTAEDAALYDEFITKIDQGSEHLISQGKELIEKGEGVHGIIDSYASAIESYDTIGTTTGMTNIANSIQTLDANCGTAVATLEDGKVKIENVGTALDAIPESATASSDSLSTMATSVSSTTTTYGTWGDAVKAKVTEVGTTIGGIVDTCTQTLAKIGGMTEEVRTVAGSLCTAAITAIGEFQQQFFTAGSNAVIGFVNGVRQNINAAGDVGREIAQTYLNSLNTALDEHSPSRETEKSGINAVLGFVNGVLNNESLVGDSGYAIADSFKTALQTSADLANNILSDDFVMDPTIRPVLDSSAIQNGFGEIDSMFGQKSMSFAAQANFAYSRRQQRIAEAEKPVVPINYRDDFKNLSDRIGTLGESLSNFKIVTDTGAVIGEFQAPMNAALGYSSMKRNRGL